jgi:RNA polymerase sigma-70 factor (ECF subfamily)
LSSRISDSEAREFYARFLSGDQAAFAELSSAFANDLLSFLLRFVGNYETAEDLMIETMSELAFLKKPYCGKSGFRTFLFAIGKHIAIDWLKKNNRQAFLSLDDFSEELTATAPPPEDSAIANEERAYVRRALFSLRVDYRCALYLLFFEDMSYSEVGVIMKKSKGQIQWLVNRAKRALREQMERDGFQFGGARAES